MPLSSSYVQKVVRLEQTDSHGRNE